MPHAQFPLQSPVISEILSFLAASNSVCPSLTVTDDTESDFLKLVEDDFFIEYEKYGRNYYGTSKNSVNDSTNSLILDLEVNGATKLLSSNKDYVGIFIDIDDKELIQRLTKRGHDEAFIDERMRLAEYQRSFQDKFQYKVDNKDINTTVNKILDIIYSLEER